ncbi:MAG: hypothetical protein M3461_02365 [Pseudomonadota bacterium]|nr:hypothetical protein [Pseudomonadota bacterium]
MIEQTPQEPQQPTGQYGSGQPPGQHPPGQLQGQYPPDQPPGKYPPDQPPGKYPPGQPPGQYPPGQSPGQYPPDQPPGQYPPGQPPGQYPPGQPPGQYPPGQPPGQYPPGQPPGEYPPGQPPGQYGKEHQPPVCPDPCDQGRPWGPPEIKSDCCPGNRECCPEDKHEDKHSCTWDEVEDPCVRAASADCKLPWAKLKCKCESSNEECTCDEWECGGYPDGVCVPCKPCEGLIPEGDDPGTGECDDPESEACTSEALSRQLNALKKCISSQQGEKAKLDADIKARLEREKELTALIATFEAIGDKYKAERHKLICREDCLKGFHRDITKVFQDKQKFPDTCLEGLEKAINQELCSLAKAQCCQKNLEGKLEKFTKLIWEQKEAEKQLKQAEEAFKAIKDFPKWMGDQFTELETLKDQIAQSLNDKDPEKHKWAFYLFYWKFVPKLCKRFAICCEVKKKTEQSRTSSEQAAVYIGCKPGDWHPSALTVEKLNALICCAWDYVRDKKEKFQEKSDAVEVAKRNLEFIKKKTEDDLKTLEDRIKGEIEKVNCATAASSR